MRLAASNLRTLTDVMAALVHGEYGYLDWQFRQLFPDTAEGPYLERTANIYGLSRKSAASGTGAISVTGTNGSTISAGAQLKTAAGTIFETTASGTISGGSVTLPVEGDEAGAATNLDAGVKLTFVTAVAGVDAEAAVAEGGIAGGADEESDDSLRARVLARIQLPPHGGNANDYIQWVLAVPGVTRAWVTPSGMGVGSVVVHFMMDEVRAANDGIPQGDGAPDYTGDIKTVADAIDPLRPVTADVFVAAPAAVAFNVTVQDLEPDTAEIRAAIDAELEALLLREAAPGGTIRLSQVYEAISIATGERHHTITAPAADKAHETNEIAVPGTVTYTTS